MSGAGSDRFDRQIVDLNQRVLQISQQLVLTLERGHLTEVGRRELLGRVREVQGIAERLPYRPKSGVSIG